MDTIRVEPWLKHSGRGGKNVTCIVLHHTAGASALSTINYLRNPLVMASYHYVIERDGKVYKCVPVGSKAWHAGLSNGPDGRNVNSYSVGIAFANKGDGEPYPQAQVDSALALISELRRTNPTIVWITAHRLITNRKIDPKGFGFKAFAAKTGLVKWMDDVLGRGWDG